MNIVIRKFKFFILKGGFLLQSDLFKQVQIYELNTRIFCLENQCRIDEIPSWFLESQEVLAADWVWLMGVWKPSPRSVEICKSHEGLQREFKKALPDFSESDIIGSPYSIYEYLPNPILAKDMAQIRKFKRSLERIGKKLILDFVPNHMSVDTPLLDTHPDLFLIKESNEECHNSFLHKNGRRYYHGRDPYFDGWTDTVQWDFSHPDVLKMHYQILMSIADVCHGVRCDMAMLPLGDIFEKTHGKKGREYWRSLINEIRLKFPGFVFIGEVYWNREYDLQVQGFDFTYDKELYDRLKHKKSREISLHLQADSNYQLKSLRFLENHDEDRAYATFGEDSISYNSLLNFLPGGVLYHEGQSLGLETRLPVQIKRRKTETVKPDLYSYFQRAFHQLMIRKKYTVNISEMNFHCYEIQDYNPLILRHLYYLTDKKVGKAKMKIYNMELFIFNPENQPISGWVKLPDQTSDFVRDLFPSSVEFLDINTGKIFRKEKTEIIEKGIYVHLQPRQSHWFVSDSDLLKDSEDIFPTPEL